MQMSSVRMRPALDILSAAERDKMRTAGRFNAELIDYLRPHVQAGITTNELDRMAHDYTVKAGHTPACLGYRGYPKSICTSINEVICHGIPEDYVLKSGDIVNVDLTSIVDGWHADQSETFIIGDVPSETRALVQCAFDCLYLAIDTLKPYSRIIEIGRAIRKHAEGLGFSVVRDYQGHGLGRKFHQEPSIPHYPQWDISMQGIPPGVCFTIEPMINAGTHKTVLDREDKWTVRTVDNKLSAQFEHTILMTETGPEIITLTKHGPQRGHKF